jgi:ribonucleoside-triphosphate reductase
VIDITSEIVNGLVQERFVKTLLPKVMRSDLKLHEFDPKYVMKSLLKETSIMEENARIVTEDVTRLIISITSKTFVVTGPMIREITNTMLLKHGLECIRLQYTRVGFPMFELKKLKEAGKTNGEISKHVWNEFNNVETIIEGLEKGDVENIINKLE